MKKLIFPAVAALALGLASCSSDEVNPGNGGQPSFAQGGYAKVAINLPSQSGSNRGANDSFEDGLASEYKVNKATLILFQGANETDAEFHSAYELNVSMEDNEDTPNQITSTTKIVERVNNGDLSGNKLYAMVILNGGTNVTVAADHLTATVYGKTLSSTGKEKIAALQNNKWNDATVNATTFTSGGILMSNAPLATKKSGETGIGINTLVDFSKAVYKTEAEAQASPATDIYVERAVGKVTVKSKEGTLAKPAGAGATEVHFKGSTGTIDYKLVGWDLDLTNTESYFSRNVDATWNNLRSNDPSADFRFIGTTPVKTGVELYRTYFAKDPNYNWTATTFDASKFTKLAKKHTINTKFGDDAPQYCLENTFNVDNQNQNQTTRVILKVKIGDGSDFYTFNGDNTTLYKYDEALTRIKQTILHVMKGKDGYSSLTAAGITGVTVSAYDASTGIVKVTGFKAQKTTTPPAGGAPTVSTETFDDSSSEVSEVNTDLKTIAMYKGGMAYYPVRIKHFGDELTPWNKTETTAPTPGTIYPTANAEKNYLGRYGVVRNNWYEIAVSSIKGIGSSIIPDPTKEPDDELYNYIAVRINVLSWAKRTQHEDL